MTTETLQFIGILVAIISAIVIPLAIERRNNRQKAADLPVAAGGADGMLREFDRLHEELRLLRTELTQGLQGLRQEIVDLRGDLTRPPPT